MTFVRPGANAVPIANDIFAVAVRAQEDKKQNGDLVVDATLGSLYDEDGNFAALHSVFDHYDQINHRTKGAYASSFLGNPGFRKTVFRWAVDDSLRDLPHTVIATPGGSGAVSVSFSTFVNPGETILLPAIGWSSYNLMASQFGIKARHYNMFKDDHFDLASLKEDIADVMKQQNRVVLVLNDPCHNPTGYSLSAEEWEALTDILNEASAQGPIVLIDDIAYIDFSRDPSHSKDFMKAFTKLSDQVLISLAFSCSKSMTSYGLRCGAAILLSKNAKALEEAEIVFEKYARAIWSNIPNAAMENFTWVINENRDAYLAEKQFYIDLLRQRSDVFLQEAKECGLPLYPYKEGFFITVKADSDKAKKIQQALMEEHVYTVVVDGGIRIAICSLPVRKASSLAPRLKRVIDSI